MTLQVNEVNFTGLILTKDELIRIANHPKYLAYCVVSVDMNNRVDLYTEDAIRIVGMDWYKKYFCKDIDDATFNEKLENAPVSDIVDAGLFTGARRQIALLTKHRQSA